VALGAYVALTLTGVALGAYVALTGVALGAYVALTGVALGALDGLLDGTAGFFVGNAGL